MTDEVIICQRSCSGSIKNGLLSLEFPSENALYPYLYLPRCPFAALCPHLLLRRPVRGAYPSRSHRKASQSNEYLAIIIRKPGAAVNYNIFAADM